MLKILYFVYNEAYTSFFNELQPAECFKLFLQFDPQIKYYFSNFSIQKGYNFPEETDPMINKVDNLGLNFLVRKRSKTTNAKIGSKKGRLYTYVIDATGN